IDPYYANAHLLRGYTYLWLENSGQAIADFTRSWELSSTGIKSRWTIEWSHMNQERPGIGKIKLLEGIADPDPERYWSLVCRGVALWLGQHFEEALALLERAISLEPYTPDCYFWQGMAYASLTEYTAAIGAIKKALELGLPPILLRPLRWFEQEK